MRYKDDLDLICLFLISNSRSLLNKISVLFSLICTSIRAFSLIINYEFIAWKRYQFSRIMPELPEILFVNDFLPISSRVVTITEGTVFFLENKTISSFFNEQDKKYLSPILVNCFLKSVARKLDIIAIFYQHFFSINCI